MTTRHLFRCASLAAILLGALAGCNRDATYPVSGSVTYNGEPLPAGEIWFDPDPSRGKSGLQGFAPIKDGRYDTRENGKGVRGGAYLVRILGFDGRPARELPLGQPLFPEHQEARALPEAASEQDFRIPKK
jgi:hypothetical protein